MRFIITPCLVGFDVKLAGPTGIARAIGIGDFSWVLGLLLKNWKNDFQVEVR